MSHWRVDHIEGQWRSVNGPDCENESEFRVVDLRSGEVVHYFLEWGDWPYLCETTYRGAAKVEISPDGAQAIVTNHDGSVSQVALPT